MYGGGVGPSKNRNRKKAKEKQKQKQLFLSWGPFSFPVLSPPEVASLLLRASISPMLEDATEASLREVPHRCYAQKLPPPSLLVSKRTRVKSQENSAADVQERKKLYTKRAAMIRYRFFIGAERVSLRLS